MELIPRRKYSVEEIDSMRDALKMTTDTLTTTEDQLRTHLVAGTEPAELVAHATAERRAYMEAQTKMYKEMNARRLAATRENAAQFIKPGTVVHVDRKTTDVLCGLLYTFCELTMSGMT